MRRYALRLALVPAIALAWCAPASAAGLGFSLPKFRALSVGGANSLGGSVQVIGSRFSLGLVKFDVGIDYAYTRDFAAGTNYSFFDVKVGGGLPFGLTQQVYLEPAVDAHTLMFVASPEGLRTPAFGVGPRLTAGFKPSSNIAVELGVGYAFMLNMAAAGKATPGALTTVEIGGTYSF